MQQIMNQVDQLFDGRGFMANNGPTRGKPFIVGACEELYYTVAGGAWNVFKIYGEGPSYEHALAAAERAAEPFEHAAYCRRCGELKRYPAPQGVQVETCPVCRVPFAEAISGSDDEELEGAL